MTTLVIEQLPVLDDNYVYVLHDGPTGATAVVDPAEAEPVLELLAGRGWSLSHILNTHHHHDHVGGNLVLKEATGARIIGARADAGRIPGIDQQVNDGESFLLGQAAAMVMSVPGHTSGHIAFWFPESHALFCGDTLFSLGCGRLFEGTAEQMWDSLSRIRSLPDETMIHCAHEYTAANGRFARTVERDNGDLAARLAEVESLRKRKSPTIPVSLEREKKTNPFLRVDLPAIAHAVGLADGAPPAQVFAELRRRKDAFR